MIISERRQLWLCVGKRRAGAEAEAGRRTRIQGRCASSSEPQTKRGEEKAEQYSGILCLPGTAERHVLAGADEGKQQSAGRAEELRDARHQSQAN